MGAGCAVGVYRAGQVAYAKGYGQANLEHGLRIDANTVFEVGSLSKQFTATAILLLAEDGKLSLDDDVRKYVPSLPDYTRPGSKKVGRPITLRDLLHHTSGLRDYSYLLMFAGYADSDVTTDDDAIWLITHQRALNFATGTRYGYTNSGYVLLSLVVRKVAGKSLAAFARERIFDPLGMSATIFLEDHRRVVPHRAMAYEAGERDDLVLAMSGRDQAGDAGVLTTIADLARWDANFYEPKVGGTTWLQNMRTRAKLDDGTQVSYAMGLDIGEMNRVALEKVDNAERAGFRTALLRFPSEQLTVTVLCNIAETDATSLATDVATALVPKLAAVEPKAASVGVPAAAEESANVTASQLSPAVGSYVDPVSLELRTVALDGTTLKLGFSVNGFTGRTLDVHDARHFSVHGATARYEFVPSAGPTPARLLRILEGKAQIFERFDSSLTNPAALADYVGRYGSDEVPRDVAIVVEDGRLRVVPWGRSPGPWAIVPVRKDTFAIDAGNLRFERDKHARVTGFTMNFPPRIEGIAWTRRPETDAITSAPSRR